MSAPATSQKAMTAQPRRLLAPKRSRSALSSLATARLGFSGRQDLALGLAAGGALSVLNLWALRWLLTALMSTMNADAEQESSARMGVLGVLLASKLALVGGGLFLLGYVLKLNTTGLALGVGAVVIGLMVEAVLSLRPTLSGSSHG